MKTWLSLLFVWVVNLSFAQQFNNWQYRKPENWTLENRQNSTLILTSPDKLSLLILLPPKALTHSLKENFQIGWKEYVQEALGINFFTEGTERTTPDGLEMVVSGWLGNKDGVPTLVHFYTIKNHQQAEYLMVLSEGELAYQKHQKEIDEFLSTFQFGVVKNAVAPASSLPIPSPKNDLSTQVKGVGNFKGNAPAGVYWALTTQLQMGWSINTSGGLNYGGTSANSIGKDLYFLVLFADAVAHWWSFLPDKGLYQFDRANQSFGLYPYQITDNKGVIITSDKKFSFSVKGKELIVDGETYYSLPSVDGVTLEGKWYRTDFDKEVKNGTYNFGYLSLTKDGRFSDSGMLEGWTRIKPGSGTYLIRDYTLLLNFNDGRKEQISFYSLQIPITDHAFINSYDISRLK